MKRIPGSRGMDAAIQFAEQHGFNVAVTKGCQLQFRGHGGRFIKPLSTGDFRAAKDAVARMRRLVAASAAK